ncbi:dehydrogenase [Paenibacillus kribbensis]|uniref:Dehydrogenase n=1 Tax=Paenibacillus kribbensis TaxID=172713 RepID=A0A222WJ91_9BACL|nr:Gfo/Idh/MocA family oxidoreductase [Paenibacillus kribbensis]ASR46166.1 dehydrogenase [Paenibacillus kribbensis]
MNLAAAAHEPAVGDIRFGIIGCSAIAPRALLEPTQHVAGARVTALANRTVAKAEEMAERFGVSVVYRHAEDLLKDPEIDAVYIALSNDLHAEWIGKALQAHKHVLVEKPLCLNTADLIPLAATVEQSSAYLLEGVMVMHHPWQRELRRIVESGCYGRLRSIATSLCIPARDGHANNYRSRPEQGGGCFWDLGVYWLQLLQAVVGLEQAEFRSQSDFDGPHGCDWTFHAQARYPGGLEASALFSFERPYRCAHVLTFDSAVVTLQDCFRANLGFYKMTLKTEMTEIVQDITPNITATAVLTEGSSHQLASHFHSQFQPQPQSKMKTVFEPMNYYVNQLEAFCSIIRGEAEPIPFREAAERVRLLAAIHEAARSGETIYAV